jgi:hypothetical protein
MNIFGLASTKSQQLSQHTGREILPRGFACKIYGRIRKRNVASGTSHSCCDKHGTAPKLSKLAKDLKLRVQDDETAVNLDSNVIHSRRKRERASVQTICLHCTREEERGGQ